MTGLELREPMATDGLTITEVKTEIDERLRSGVQPEELRLLVGSVLDELPSVFKLEPGDRLFGVLVI